MHCTQDENDCSRVFRAKRHVSYTKKTDGCQTYKPIRGFNPFSKSRHFWHLITNFKLFLLTILTCCCHKTYYNVVIGSRSYSSLHKGFELYFTVIKSSEIPNCMHYIIFQRHINITTMFDTGHLTRNNNIWVHEIDFVCPLIGKSNIQSSFPCYINFCFIHTWRSQRFGSKSTRKCAEISMQFSMRCI